MIVRKDIANAELCSPAYVLQKRYENTQKNKQCCPAYVLHKRYENTKKKKLVSEGIQLADA
eukprot:2703103-Karenia_brevis.AAC.1